MFRIDKIEIVVGFECHVRPISVCVTNISKLNSLRNECRQPCHHIYLKSIWTRLPPELVNVRAYKPVKGSSGWSTKEYYRRGHCTLKDHVFSWCHEGYDRAQRYRKAAGRKREKLHFLDGRWDWTIIHNSWILFIFLAFSSSAWSNANSVIIFCSCTSRCPSFLGSS